MEDLVKTIPLSYIDPLRVVCYRSKGSRSKRGIARCYSLLKIWQQALGLPSYYIIEVISERYDRMSQEDKVKVMIHELLHIPKTFGGGLRPHAGYVTRRAIDQLYLRYLSNKR
jgi:predicted metallopeptidase